MSRLSATRLAGASVDPLIHKLADGWNAEHARVLALETEVAEREDWTPPLPPPRDAERAVAMMEDAEAGRVAAREGRPFVPRGRISDRPEAKRVVAMMNKAAIDRADWQGRRDEVAYRGAAGRLQTAYPGYAESMIAPKGRGSADQLILLRGSQRWRLAVVGARLRLWHPRPFSFFN
jgi:hypothetical protein